jgi:hypothetical protein
MATRARAPGGGHRSGKLVVLAMIVLGVFLGIFALRFRTLMPKTPATQPAPVPAVAWPVSL